MNGKVPTPKFKVYDTPLVLNHSHTKYENLFYNGRKAAYVDKGFTVHLKARIFDGDRPVGELVTHKPFWYVGGDLSLTTEPELSEKKYECTVFKAPFKIHVKSLGKGIIRYTLDGSEPNASSAEYKGPVKIDHTMTKKTEIGWNRAIAKHMAFAWTVRLRAKLFSEQNELINGLGANQIFAYQGDKKEAFPETEWAKHDREKREKAKAAKMARKRR